MVSKSEFSNKKRSVTIGIIDTETSNLKSVISACEKEFLKVYLLKKYANISNDIDGLIFPGVGSFNFVMKTLKRKKLDKFILEFLKTNKPSLFICLGMQLLFSYSEEVKKSKGLNIFPGSTTLIQANGKRRVPIIGWNTINQKNKNDIFYGIKKTDTFYFTHSFYVLPKNKKIISSESEYCGFKYCSSIAYKNIYGLQFHPEKSSTAGLKIYENFRKLCLV
jgi:glutamine amidotransferase